MSFSELSKECSKKWKEMSEEDKAPYTEKAAADKERFEKENEAYKEANPDIPQTKKSKKSTKSGPAKAKSAYQYFCTEQRAKIKEENPDADPPELMRLLGAAWKDLSEEDKAPYNEKAATDKERYDEEMKEEKYKKKYFNFLLLLERMILLQSLKLLILSSVENTEMK